MGTFVEKNDSQTMKPEEIFLKSGMAKTQSNDDIKVDYIYDITRTDEDTYEATRIALYDVSLEQTSQGQKSGVVLFTTIVYKEQHFGKPWSFVMLTQIKGGVVKNDTNYWCENISFRYHVYGDGYTAAGTRVGWTGKEVQYNGVLSYPTVGTTYYINGPSDYYYDMGVHNSAIVGFMRGTITYRGSSNQSQLEVASSITSI